MHFKPLHLMTYWKKNHKHPLPNSEKVFESILSLPVHDALTEEEQQYVIDKVYEFYAETT
jgi:dTDP-4-amino-4,6-dideoxygalactose transaminase